MDMRDSNKNVMEALEGYMAALHDQAYEIVMRHWDAVKLQERKTPGWENSSNLQLRCELRGNSLRIDWCGIKWLGSKKMDNRRMVRITISKPAGVNSYSLSKLYAHAKEWEKPLIKETEGKLAAIRCEASHVIKAIRSIRNAAKARFTSGGEE